MALRYSKGYSQICSGLTWAILSTTRALTNHYYQVKTTKSFLLAIILLGFKIYTIIARLTFPNQFYHPFLQLSTRHPGMHSRPSRYSVGSQSAIDQTSALTIGSSAKDQLLTPFAGRITDAELSCDCISFHGSSSTLIEIAFRPQSLHYSPCRAIIYDTRDKWSMPFSQLAQVIKSFDPIRTINSLGIQ